MKILYKINLLVLISVLALVITLLFSKEFRREESQYYSLVEQIKTLQIQVLNALVWEKNFEKNVSNEQQVFDALNQANQSLKKIDLSLLKESAQKAILIQGLLNEFGLSFSQMLQVSLELKAQKKKVNDTVTHYAKTYDQVTPKMDLALIASLRGDQKQDYQEFLVEDGDTLQELRNTSLISLSLIQRILVLTNQDLLLDENFTYFDQSYQETIRDLATQDENIQIQAEVLDKDFYRNFAQELTTAFQEAQSIVSQMRKTVEERQSISQALQNNERQISKITEELTVVSEKIRLDKNRREAQLEILGQGVIITLLLVGGFLLGRSITRPLSMLTEATESLNPKKIEELKSGIYPETMHLNGRDEISILAQSFEKMRHEIIDEFHLIEQQKDKLIYLDQLKDEFLANTSHELRTPLNGIIGIAESLVDGATGALPQATLSNLSLIVSSGRRLSHLVNDILDLSKLKHNEISLQIKPLELRAVVDVVINLSKALYADKPIEIQNHIPKDLTAVLGDENRLQQILHNLVGNSIKFTAEGFIEISAVKKEELVYISVKDTGIGISQDKIQKIFQNFEQADSSTQREYGGTGLGLSITQKLVELHGGVVEVESEIDQGSKFTFTLLATDEQVEESSEHTQINRFLKGTPSPKLNTSTTQKSPQELSQEEERSTILVVDDELINHQVMENVLTLQNYSILHASNGPEAIQAIEEGEQLPDLILLDIMMPKMSGFEVCEKLRVIHPPHKLPILFLSAKNQISDLIEGFSTGGNDYLSKPFSKNELLARIQIHLRISQLNKKLLEAKQELEEINYELEEKVENRTQALQDSFLQLEGQHQQLEKQHEQLKEMQTQLIHAEKMSSLGTLVAGIAHEINNPTAFARLGAQSLEDKLALFKTFIFEMIEEEDQQMFQVFEDKFKLLFVDLKNVLEGTYRIQGIVSDLRSFARLNEAEYKTSDIFEGLRATLSLVQANYKKHVDFLCNVPDEFIIFCWPNQLNQVFMNLLVNACQAICQKQEEKQFKEKGIIKINSLQKDGYVGISFEDNGGGIPEHVKNKIFEPFFTTKEIGKGTGLGLSISHGIVERHQGYITVDSIAGKGTNITVFLSLNLEKPSLNPSSSLSDLSSLIQQKSSKEEQKN